MLRHPSRPVPPVRLRGHHLLCVFGFRGLGYSEAFVAGMSAVVRRLRAPGARVDVVAGPDDICAACPRVTTGRCAPPENQRDAAVLAALGLAVGHRQAAATLFPQVAARLSPADLAVLCDGCPWQEKGLCAAGLAAGRIACGWEDDVCEELTYG